LGPPGKGAGREGREGKREMEGRTAKEEGMGEGEGKGRGGRERKWKAEGLTVTKNFLFPMTLVSRNIKFVWIFAGVPWRGASNDSGVIEDVDFQYFRMLNLRPILLYIII